MMMNLFSVFDPVSVSPFSLNWLSVLLLFIFSPLMYWSVSCRFSKFSIGLSEYICSEFLNLLKKSSFVIIFFFSMFLFILYNNMGGLLSYVFTGSSHLVYSLSFGLSLWMCVVLFGWVNNSENLLVHLIPQGTPWFLMFFMVIIEMVSNVIRPVTLSIRLAANMIAGHLLLVLLSSSMVSSGLVGLGLLGLGDLMLSLLELGVALIQAYVFSVLSVLYLAESAD